MNVCFFPHEPPMVVTHCTITNNPFSRASRGIPNSRLLLAQLLFPFIASPHSLMKRSSPSFNPSYIIKTIPNSDKSHSRGQGQSRERCPSDVGNTYITVPVYKTNEKFTKKQIKDASTMYNICGTSSHSFVLALKSDPSIHIAVPYYRTCESTMGGKQFVTVSNFFPLSTVQATPPPGVNV